MIARIVALVALLLATAVAGVAPAAAQDPPANDLLNAVLWMQRSVEYRASAMTAFALAISSSAWRKPNSGCSAAQPDATFRISVEGLIG